MSITGEELGVVLYELLKAGQQDLPEVARDYAEANRALSRTFGLEYTAFPGVGPCPATVDLARRTWTALRDNLQGALYETTEALTSTSEALCVAAYAYAEADHGAQEGLREVLGRRGYPRKPDVPDPVRP